MDQLLEVEQRESKKLAQAVRETLQDVRENPELSKRPITHWTNAELHNEIPKR